LVAVAARGQQLKLSVLVLNSQNEHVMANIQVKEVDEVTGAEVLQTFTSKKGKLIIPLALGKKYVLHFWAPNKEFRSVIVDCTSKGLNMNQNYWFGFDITLPDEETVINPVSESETDLVAMIWIAYNKVQYKLL
jgi:hypothetical protein